MLGLVDEWFLSGNSDTLMVQLLFVIDVEWGIVIAYIFRAKKPHVWRCGILFQVPWSLKSSCFIFEIIFLSVWLVMYLPQLSGA